VAQRNQVWVELTVTGQDESQEPAVQYFDESGAVSDLASFTGRVNVTVEVDDAITSFSDDPDNLVGAVADDGQSQTRYFTAESVLTLSNESTVEDVSPNQVAQWLGQVAQWLGQVAQWLAARHRIRVRVVVGEAGDERRTVSYFDPPDRSARAAPAAAA